MAKQQQCSVNHGALSGRASEQRTELNAVNPAMCMAVPALIFHLSPIFLIGLPMEWQNFFEISIGKSVADGVVWYLGDVCFVLATGSLHHDCGHLQDTSKPKMETASTSDIVQYH